MRAITFFLIFLAACTFVNNKYANEVAFDGIEFIDSIAYYQGDVYTGKAVVFHENSTKKFEADYVNGIDDGLFKEWDENGNLIEVAKLKNGKLEGKRFRFHTNGNMQFEGHYVNGFLSGISKEWYDNGNLCIEKENQNGIENGKFTFYLEEGQKKLEGYMVMGKREGLWVEFDSEGVPIYNHYYEGGEIQRSESLK
jgi:antitoxin component YwqK of YwqJK toxin-antitoxin module